MKSYRRAIVIGKPFLPITEISLETILRCFGQDENAEVRYLTDPENDPVYSVGSLAMTEECLAITTRHLFQSAATSLLRAKTVCEIDPEDVLLSVASALVHGRYKDISSDADLFDSIASMKGEPCVIIEVYAMTRFDQTTPVALVRLKESALRDDLSREIAEDVLARTLDIREFVDVDPTKVSEDDLGKIVSVLSCFVCNAGVRCDSSLSEAAIYGLFDIVRASVGAFELFMKACVEIAASGFFSFLPPANIRGR